MAAVTLAVADAVLVLLGAVVAVSRAGADRLTAVSAAGAPLPLALPAAPSRPVTAADVAGRPRPDPVTAKGRWTATLVGSGDRAVFYAPVTAMGAGSVTATDFRSGAVLALPDGTRWDPVEPFRIDGVGDVPLLQASASGGTVRGTVAAADLDRVLGSGTAEAHGRFVQRDGPEAATLRLPAGTRISADCAGPGPGSGPGQAPRPCPSPAAVDPVTVTVAARPGLRLVADGSTGKSGYGNGEGGVEVEVAGAVRAAALGREWDGVVGSLEADDLDATAEWDGSHWTVRAAARSARQVWIDVCPVVGTVVEVTSDVSARSHTCTRDCSVRLHYANRGYATAQIFEAEAIGGANSVDLGIKETGTHDAGLGVHRGGREINLGSGRGIDSHVPPGDSHDRALTFTPGVPVTLVLRGNFPDVRVALPTGSVAAA